MIQHYNTPPDPPRYKPRYWLSHQIAVDEGTVDDGEHQRTTRTRTDDVHAYFLTMDEAKDYVRMITREPCWVYDNNLGKRGKIFPSGTVRWNDPALNA